MRIRHRLFFLRHVFVAGFLLAMANCGSDSAAECTEATAGCICGEGARCDDGSSCVAGRCTRGEQFGVRISDPSARSCEVTLDDPQRALAGVRFEEAVLGDQQRRGAVVAVGFLGANDGPIDGSAVRVALVPGVAAAEAGLSVRSSRCFDRLGQPLSKSRVDLGI